MDSDSVDPAESIIFLRATSNREWRLRPVRQLSSNVHLVRDVARPNAPPLALKTFKAPSDQALRLAVDDSSIWLRCFKADPEFIVPLLDVAVHRSNVYFITPYCPGPDCSVQRSEHAALRCIAAIATAVDVVVAVSGQSAHANLYPSHIFTDHAGVPRLSGWGFARAVRFQSSSSRPAPTERDDVRALAAILYTMIYGQHFDSSRVSSLPPTPDISPPTRTLLQQALFDNFVTELSVFRYDVAAARGFVPVCGPALTPIVNRRREQLLDSDLDSIRGGDPRTPALPSSSPPPAQMRSSPPSPSPIRQELNRSPIRRASPPTHPPHSPVLPPSIPKENPISDAYIEETVRAATGSDLAPVNNDLIDRLIDMCVHSDQAPERIFKVMFRLPISKNPIVAFKVVTALHRFISDGLGKLTTQAIENDGFLGWIESSWSRERIQNKSGKLHSYTYCFAAGEISWYTSLVRKRCEALSKFSQIFTVHWMLRLGSPPALGPRRRDAFRIVIEILEKSSSILRKAVASRDPVAVVKWSAVPPLLLEVCKTYLVSCWLFCTADKCMQADLLAELSLAHRATRVCIQSVSEQEDLVPLCHPFAFMQLEEEVDLNFVESELVAKLKQLRKKKKRKVTEPPLSISEAKASPTRASANVPEVAMDAKRELPRMSNEANVRQLQAERKSGRANGQRRSEIETVTMDSDGEDNMTENSEPSPEGRQIERQVEIRYGRQPEDEHDEGEIHWHDTHHSNTEGRVTSPVNGLKKLSVSVRKGKNGKDLPSNSNRGSSQEEWVDGEIRQRASPGYREDDNPERRRNYRSRRSPEGGGAGSDDGVKHSQPNGRARRERERSHRSEKERRRRNSSDGASEEISDEEPKPEKRISRKKSKDRVKGSKGRAPSSDGEGSGDLTWTDGPKKATVLKSADEKAIPFDKTPPLKRKSKASAKKNVVKEETSEPYSGGSKEALAAAAQGRKTPSINPDYEVAPYEVHFGPQIGSGGFGVVFKAKFRSETVAVKKIHGHALSNASSVAEFQSEVAVLCTLRHANILRFVGACTKPPNLMIITEFMGRGTVFDLLHQSQDRVTWPMRKKFALDTCKGMRYLHDSKLLHRDLKSSNLMLDNNLNCKVGDFGLTRISKGTAAVQMTGQCGTFQYMAVEVLANKPYSEKADVFSFGILLWEMVARKLPYFGMQPMQVGIAVLQQGMRPPIPAKAPAPLVKLMRLCWDSDPNQRPSFAQLVVSLESMPE